MPPNTQQNYNIKISNLASSGTVLLYNNVMIAIVLLSIPFRKTIKLPMPEAVTSRSPAMLNPPRPSKAGCHQFTFTT
ncbi:hypothetical protein EWM64_g5903 [Hericium alpestre]|uniref:Uncharacterized protein n=1 Tax=Hericium alpestre TaxID=135208 RepID=A0A4Y9ZVC5_9AGAM|nr:hypothetical protein EWM64_g5903 [Hericium alpestre]